MMCLEDQRSRILGQYARFNSYLKELFNEQPVEMGEPNGRQTYFYTLLDSKKACLQQYSKPRCHTKRELYASVQLCQ